MSKVGSARPGGRAVPHYYVEPYSDDVKKMQLRMQAAGIDPGPIDGLKGPLTRAAMRKYEEKVGKSAADGLDVDPSWAEMSRDRRSTASGQPSSLGLDDGPDRDEKIGRAEKGANGEIKTVIRDGKPIGAHLAGAFDAMAAAAKRDGVDLQVISGYRSHAQQVALWNANPNPRMVARPGTSNHETGDAIDFANNPGAYAWLKKNAAKFGLYNYPAEAWHYSTNGR